MISGMLLILRHGYRFSQDDTLLSDHSGVSQKNNCQGQADELKVMQLIIREMPQDSKRQKQKKRTRWVGGGHR